MRYAFAQAHVLRGGFPNLMIWWQVKSIHFNDIILCYLNPCGKILMKPAEEFKTIGRDLPSVAPLLHRDIFHIPTAWDKRTSWSLEDGRPMMAGVRKYIFY